MLSFAAFRRLTSSLLPGALCLAALVSCVAINDHKGVSNVWRKSDAPTFEAGVTTRADVLAAFGPPSQVIDQDDGIIFYYMLEQSRGRGMFLVFYNATWLDVDYDRAIFFFDEEGRLTEHAYSRTAIPADRAG